MNTAAFLSDEDFKDLVREKIEERIPKPKYLGEYKKWEARYEKGYDISYIAAFYEVPRRVVVQGLYALDVSPKKPTDVSDELEENLILEYYADVDVSYKDLSERYNLHKRKPSWITRLPALRLLIEEAENETSEFEGDMEFTDEEIEEIKQKIEENPEKYTGWGGAEEAAWELPEEDKIKKASDVLMF